MSRRNPFTADPVTTASAQPRSGTGERRRAFVQAYITNGHNATQAAIAAGYSPATARSQGQRLLTNVDIGRELAAAAQDVAAMTGLETERTLNEIACISYIDPAELYDEDNNLLPIRQLPRHVRAAIASIEHDKDTGRATKVKLWDKPAALEKAMKHHGLYEKDNSQKGDSVKVQVLLVGPR